MRLVFLNVPPDELCRRLEARRRELLGTFALDRAALDLFLSQFEPPTQEEGAGLS